MPAAARRAPPAILAFALVFGIATTAPGQQLKKILFLTNYVLHGRHAPFFVGVERGFYRDAGLDVDIAPTSGSGFVLSALEGGKADYGMAEAASLVQAVGKGARVKGFAVFMDVSTSGLAALAPHRTPASVIGKTIAASLTDSARVILPIVIRKAGLDPSSLQWLAADPSIYFSLLISGRADLITASSDGDLPALVRVAQPRGRTVHFTAFADWGYDVFGYFLVARADRLTDSPGEVRAFAAATAKAVSYSFEHSDEAARIMVRRHPTLDYETTLAHWTEAIKAMRTPYVERHGYGVATQDRLQRSIDLVREAFPLDRALTPEDLYGDGFVRR